MKRNNEAYDMIIKNRMENIKRLESQQEKNLKQKHDTMKRISTRMQEIVNKKNLEREH